MRTFIAIDLEPSLKQNLCDLLRRLKKLNDRSVSWVRESGMHLTLKFLGEIDEDQAVNIAEILKNVCSISSSFPLSLRGTGFFPANARNPRVLWIGIIEEPALMNLQACLESKLERLGFPKEERPFHPHLTLGRVKSSLNLGEVMAELEKRKDADFGDMAVKKITFFKSTLKPSGAEYSHLAEGELA
jgi:2'-5' RNA ligase